MRATPPCIVLFSAAATATAEQQEQTSYFEYDVSIHFTKCRSGKLGHILHEHPVCVCAHTFTKYSCTYTDVSVCVCVCVYGHVCVHVWNSTWN